MKDSPDKIERMKEVLADSYPKTAEKDRQALPAAARQLLEKNSPGKAAEETQSLWQRLREFLRGPQLIGLGAAAVLVVVVALQLGGDPATDPTDPNGTSFRSGAGDNLPSMLVVMKNLNDEQAEAIRSSGYFRDEQLLVLEAEDDLQEYRDHQVVLVDGSIGEITTPFAVTKFTEKIESDPEDLPTQVLDLLSAITEDEE